MSRLFVGKREQNFIADITKELISDVVGQFVIYFPISETKSQADSLYNEAPEKVFDTPIKIPALVDSPDNTTNTGIFGPERRYKLEIYFQYRDLVDRGITVSIGDFCQYGDEFYEILGVSNIQNIFGQTEYIDGVHVSCTKARKSLFHSKVVGPTDIKYTNPDAVQTTFVQSRGYGENREGPTGDVRALQKDGLLERPADGPAEVSPKGGNPDVADDSSFYDES